MGDSSTNSSSQQQSSGTKTNTNNAGVTSTSTSTSTSTGASGQPKGNGSKKRNAALNPDAKDYVPRTTVTDGSSTTAAPAVADRQAGGSSANSQNRRRRNPDTKKSGNRNSNNAGNGNGTGTGDDASRQSEKNRNASNNNTSRNRRRQGHGPKPTIEGGARIDDYHQDDDIEINMDRPVETPERQATPTGSGSGAGPSVPTKDHRRDGRRKGKEVSAESSQKPQNNKGDQRRPKGAKADGQPEGSSSARANGGGSGSNNNNNNRRQRNRKGDLGGRTFPTASAGQGLAGESASGSSRNTQRNMPRIRPRKFVHTVEEDRDLMAALTAGLTNSTYECMVCWDVVRPAHKVWNCQVCWAAFHLDCLSTWARKSSEARAIRAHVPHVEALVLFSHAIVETKPFSCVASIPISHSKLESPTEEQKCYCGKHKRDASCGDGEPRTTLIDGVEQTGYYECHEVCNRTLACGHHECTKICHPLDDEPGQCPARPEVVTTCPCGSKTIETLLMGKTRTTCTDRIPVCGGLWFALKWVSMATNFRHAIAFAEVFARVGNINARIAAVRLKALARAARREIRLRLKPTPVR
ncbi:Transcriptional repressor NF-X1 [Mortierella polycephala]|uniref:Transcriptional repressor NF-X1 n=1 Tax=Mortierella polycephala TaxID=41804 RepID=A0A9P6U629_9FUNG|nr:Transcriptional repressor NF-X1 [Mortierella polycephala]